VTNNYISGTSNEGIQIGDGANNINGHLQTRSRTRNTANVPSRGAIRILAFYGGLSGQTPSTPGALARPGGTLTNANNSSLRRTTHLHSDGVYPPNLTSLLINQNVISVNGGTTCTTPGTSTTPSSTCPGTTSHRQPGDDQRADRRHPAAIVNCYLDRGPSTTGAGALLTESGFVGFDPT